MITETTKYVTEDGMEFDTMEDALVHEKVQFVRDLAELDVRGTFLGRGVNGDHIDMVVDSFFRTMASNYTVIEQAILTASKLTPDE
jgi:hypothetical protein